MSAAVKILCSRSYIQSCTEHLVDARCARVKSHRPPAGDDLWW